MCWFNGLLVKYKNSLNNIVKVCLKIAGVHLRVFPLGSVIISLERKQKDMHWILFLQLSRC